MRIAFFGGSFDPPHLGHLAVARAAQTAFALDSVVFAPVGAQPLKPAGSTASFEDRVAMTRLAIAGATKFALSLADAPKPTGAANYTIETLKSLKAELPLSCTLYCLMGADSFVGLQRWHRAAEIPFFAPLIVASRPGQPLGDLKALLPQGLTMGAASEKSYLPKSEVPVKCFTLLNMAGERTPFYLLPGLDVEISASDIRAQVQSNDGLGEAGHPLLPEAVADYIRVHGLYR